MVIEVRLYATLRSYTDIANGVFSQTLTKECTVAELVNSLKIDLAQIHIIMINGVSSTLETTLHDGDRLGLFPAVGGG